MTMGGKNEISKITVPKGIGWDKLGKLWYRTNTKYLVASSDFTQAARATLTAAKDLAFTADEQAIVECAWIATGVLEGTCKALSDAKPSAEDGDTTPTSDEEAEETPTKKKKPSQTPAPAAGAGCTSASSAASGYELVLLAVGAVALRRRKRRD